MTRKLYRTYKHLLDVKLKDSTFLIVIIGFLIFSVGIIVPNNTITNSKNNIIEIQKQNNLEFQNIIKINGKKYKFYLEEII